MINKLLGLILATACLAYGQFGVGNGEYLSISKTLTGSLSLDEAGYIIDNTGASGSITLTLPTAFKGITFFFYVTATQTLAIKATAATTIVDGSTTSIATGVLASNVTGSTVILVAISPTQWTVRGRAGNWTLDGNALGDNNQGILRISNPGVTLFTMKPPTALNGAFTAPANPVSTVNNIDNTVATTSVAGKSSWNCAIVANGSGDYVCTTNRAAVPLPNRDTQVRSAIITATGTYYPLGCIAVDATQFVGFGHGYRYQAYGNVAINVADSPVLQFKAEMFTNSTCSTGAATVAPITAFPASTGAINNFGWFAELEFVFAASGPNVWEAGGFISANVNAAANSVPRLAIPQASVFDPTTCTLGLCGFQLSVQAVSGTITNSPTLVKSFDQLTYR